MTDYPTTESYRGHIHVSDGTDTWKVPVDNWSYSSTPKPMLTQIAGDDRVAIDLGERERVFRFTDLHFFSCTDCDAFEEFIDDYTKRFTLKIQIHSDGSFKQFGNSAVANNINANKEETTVIFGGYKNVYKSERGDSTHFVIGSLILKEGGT